MSTPVNITLDSASVVDDLDRCEIGFEEGHFCFSIDLAFKSMKYWSQCNPKTLYGATRLGVHIGNDSWYFLLEERTANKERKDSGFSIWGRTKQALLDIPYSKAVVDKSSTSHPWQTGNTSAQAIVSYVCSQYLPYSATVNWNVDNFLVYQGTFSADNVSVKEIVEKLAAVGGYELVPETDGSLSVEEYITTPTSSVQTITAMDDISTISDEEQLPSGYNAVTVFGRGGDPEKDSFLSAEAKDADATPKEGQAYGVRVYYYHPQGYTPQAYAGARCTVSAGGSGVETITEDVTFTWGVGTYSKTDTNGNRNASGGSSSVPIQILSKSYNCRYKDFYIYPSADPDGDGFVAMFYFPTGEVASVSGGVGATDTGDASLADKNASTTFSGTIAGSSASYSSAIALDSTSAVAYGEQFGFRVYPGNDTISSVEDSGGGGSVSGGYGPYDQYVTESVALTDGVGSTTYPIQSIISSSPSISLQYTRGKSSVTTNHSSYNSGYKYVSVTYTTRYYQYYSYVPRSYNFSSFAVWANMQSGARVSTSVSLTDPDDTGDYGGTTATEVNVTITVADYSTDQPLADATVWVGGVNKGVTDENGQISFTHATGTYSFKATKSGYYDTDQDSLENETITFS